MSPTATTSLGSSMKRLIQLGDVDQPVLVNADVHEGAESRDVRDHALQDHALAQVGQVVDPFGELGHAELLTRIAARLLQLVENVLDRGQPGPVVDELSRVETLDRRRVADERFAARCPRSWAIFSTR